MIDWILTHVLVTRLNLSTTEEVISPKSKEAILKILHQKKIRAEKLRKHPEGRDFGRNEESALNVWAVRDTIGNVK